MTDIYNECEIYNKLICDCCGEKGAFNINDVINVCPDCIDYAMNTAQVIKISTGDHTA